MNIIKQNPFRILGLTGNVTEKELQKQIGIIKRYAEVGKTKSFDYDFEFIGDFTRTSVQIQQASNSIGQAHKKLHYSLFWFVKNTAFDEIAFNNLKEKETSKAIEIWNKTLKEEITSKNYSSYLNLSTIYIALSTINTKIELQKLQLGISLKGILIHSENLKDFSKLVTGSGIANDPIDISKYFVDEVIELLKPYLNKRNGITTNDLISLFNSFPTSIKKYISAKFTEIPISNIETKIEKTVLKRKETPEDSEEHGEELYKSTKSDITLLKKLLGKDNVQFKMIANNLADEIMQCSIEFFNKWNSEDGEFDPMDDALKIAKYAKSAGATGQSKNRIDEGIDTLVNMKFEDCYQALEALIQIYSIYAKLDEDNKSRSIEQQQYIDHTKIIQFLKPILSTETIKKTAESAKNDLISDFYDILLKLIKITETNKLAIFDMFSIKSQILSNSFISTIVTQYKDNFIDFLPSNNQIKVRIEKEKEREIISQNISKVRAEVRNLEKELSSTRSKVFYSSNLEVLKTRMKRIKQWHLFRSSETKEYQISEQQLKIDALVKKGIEEKKKDISRLEEQLVLKRVAQKKLKKDYSKV